MNLLAFRRIQPKYCHILAIRPVNPQKNQVRDIFLRILARRQKENRQCHEHEKDEYHRKLTFRVHVHGTITTDGTC